jgi:iron complex transport system substrate-binding protein
LKKLALYLLIITSLSCSEKKKKNDLDIENSVTIELKYAQGFGITSTENSKTIEIKNPWPNSEKTYIHTLKKNELPIKKIVVTSTTHIPALELLGVEDALVGFPGCDYISSTNTRRRIDDGSIRELGKNEGINTEVLLELQPDIVIGFGVDGSNKTFNTLEKSGIEVIYNGDWVEDSPLAKAEWIKFFGALFNKEKEADSIFNAIERDYIEAKELAEKINHKPTILSGALHKDVWYLPSGTSPEAQFLKDANVYYLWQDTTAKGSLALSFETVFEKAHNANIWLSPSYYKSLEALKKANQHYVKFEAFKSKQVFSFSNTVGATGGVLYYEMGAARPDLVLKDIIKVCHPKLLEDYQPVFFKPLK